MKLNKIFLFLFLLIFMMTMLYGCNREDKGQNADLNVSDKLNSITATENVQDGSSDTDNSGESPDSRDNDENVSVIFGNIEDNPVLPEANENNSSTSQENNGNDLEKPNIPDRPKPIVDKTVSILFIGNSLVYYNNLPQQLGEISLLYGIEIDCTSICPPGASLEDTKYRAKEAMKAYKFDYAVFQDYGTRPFNEKDNFLNDIKMLCDEAKNAGITPVLYNPAWASMNGKPDNDFQYLLTEVYERAAKDNDVMLVNAGDVWVYAYKNIPGISLYEKGDYHPNVEGVYLTACVFASTLFDLHIKDFSADNGYMHDHDNALKLGQAAWEFVSYYKGNGRSPDGVVTVASGTNKKING